MMAARKSFAVFSIGVLPTLSPRLRASSPLVDPDGRLAWSNRWPHGYDAFIVGTPADELFVEEDRPIWWAAFRQALDLGGTTDNSMRLRIRAAGCHACHRPHWPAA